MADPVEAIRAQLFLDVGFLYGASSHLPDEPRRSMQRRVADRARDCGLNMLELIEVLQSLINLAPDNVDDFPGEPEKYEAARVAIARALGQETDDAQQPG